MTAKSERAMQELEEARERAKAAAQEKQVQKQGLLTLPTTHDEQLAEIQAKCHELEKQQAEIQAKRDELIALRFDLRQLLTLPTAHDEQLAEIQAKSHELEKQLAEIQAKRDELEKYIMTLCHELRTPLNGMLGMLQVLQSKYQQLPSSVMTEGSEGMEAMIQQVAKTGNPEPMLSMMKEIFGNRGGPLHTKITVDKLLALANLQLAICEDLLDYTRAQTGKGTKQVAVQFNLHAALVEAMDCVQAALPRAANSDFEAKVESDMRDIEMIGDKRRIVQVLINLLSNAFKATSTGSVTLSVYACSCITGDRLPPGCKAFCFEVRDTGRGMSKGSIGKDFETPFAAGSNGSKTGLGFGIVHHVVEQILGGKLRVVSEEGKGTTVHVALPLKPAELSTHKGDAWTHGLSRAKTPPEQIPILIVDDQKLNTDMLRSLLEAIGYTHNVDTADDGDTALAMIDERYKKGEPKYDVVFMDVQMKRLNGDEATQELRHTEFKEGRSPTHVIGLSAYANDTTREKCLAMGMNAYCFKPMQISTLRDVLSSLPNNQQPLTGWEPGLRHVKHQPSPQAPPPTRVPSNEIDLTEIDLTDDDSSAVAKQEKAFFLSAIDAAMARGTFEQRQARFGGPLPADFAEADHSIVNLKEAWTQGVPNRDMIITAMSTVYAINLDKAQSLMKTQEWEELKKEVHCMAGLCTHIRAYPLRDALRTLEEQARGLHNCTIVEDNGFCHSLFTAAHGELMRVKREIAPFVEKRGVMPVEVVATRAKAVVTFASPPCA